MAHTRPARPAAWLALVLAALGAVVVVGTSLLGGVSWPVLLFAAWALVPYALLILAGRVLRSPWVVAGAGLAAFAAEIGIRLSVFAFPRGSTAAVALVFSPLLLVVIFMPAGALAGYVLGMAMRTGRPWLQGLAGGAAIVALCLTTLAFGRPDLFPTTVYRRQQTLSEVGPPRIVAGEQTFERVVVTDQANWRLAGDFDGEPGEEIALVSARTVQLVTPGPLSEGSRVELTGDAGRTWNWFSRLARSDGRLVIVETGGGFQETRVRSLDGAELWRYHPDADLPPTALVPADLDHDGNAEFYTATTDSLARLDGSGHETWRVPFSLGTILAAVPGTRTDAAWVVATGHGQLEAWSADGRRLGAVALGNHLALGAIDWPDRRRLLTGGETLRAIDLDGTVAFEWTVPGMTVHEALAVTYDPAGQSYLALVAAAPRDTNRWRVQLVSTDRTVVYDQVFGAPPRLLKARGADGADTLFVSGDSLVALRPRRAR